MIPSHNESFGLVCLESLLAGVPVFAAATGMMPSLIKQGYGEIVDIKNLKEVEEKFRKFIENIDSYSVNIKDLSQRFSIETMVNKYENIF